MEGYEAPEVDSRLLSLPRIFKDFNKCFTKPIFCRNIN